MDKTFPYYRQVALLVRVLSYVANLTNAPHYLERLRVDRFGQ